LLLVGEVTDEGELRGAFVGGDQVDDVGRDLRGVVKAEEPEGAEGGEGDQREAGEEFLAERFHCEAAGGGGGKWEPLLDANERE
jgi:hypothetical protein